MSQSYRRENHVVIVGGGIAGLFCAMKLGDRPITIVTPAPIGEGASSAWAQGGIAAAVAEGDTPESHAADTIEAGAGLVDAQAALAMAREAPDRVRDLLALGVPFDRDLEGRLLVSREAAHAARRIVHVKGDMAGRAIMAALADAVRRRSNIRLIEDGTAEQLLVEQGQVEGVRIRRTDDQLSILRSNTIVLATGGVGALYAVTTNPQEANGSGLGMAALAGAILGDAEFVQFHPTAIAIGRDPAPLATEALRGDGALLVNRAGERFMARLHPLGELAPRDIVARGVFAEIASDRGAFLDARASTGAVFPEKFPTVFAACQEAGLNPIHDLIPVAPAAHYHMGGILTDDRGRTSLQGLWAAGEVASTGVHGANRLASNSLLEAVVYAARIADDISAQTATSPNDAEYRGVAPRDQRLSAIPSALRELMTRNVGVIRSADGLRNALQQIGAWEGDNTLPLSLRNSLSAALLIVASAWRRKESRGGHFRSDFPSSNSEEARRSSITLEDARSIAANLSAPNVHRKLHPA